VNLVQIRRQRLGNPQVPLPDGAAGNQRDEGGKAKAQKVERRFSHFGFHLFRWVGVTAGLPAIFYRRVDVGETAYEPDRAGEKWVFPLEC
jgi:hypothetical protein